jgi:hypothetical protein
MAATRDDFKHLQVPLLVAVVLVVLGAATVAAMYKWTERARLQNVNAQMLRNDAGGRLARATEEEREIKLNILQYRRLAERGIIGEEHRLDWIERLATIKTSRRLFDIHYDIAQQRKLDSAATNGPAVMVSKMDISMPLLHEGDLFNLIDDLRATPRGYFQVKKCSIRRSISAPTDRKVLAPMLSAGCELDFFTIREPEQAKVAGL